MELSLNFILIPFKSMTGTVIFVETIGLFH